MAGTCTGDLGRLDQQGFLSICGRVKNLIVTPNGKNVYPEEVEDELLKSPYIAEVMVYGHRVGAAEEIHAVIYPDQQALDDLANDKGKCPMTLNDLEALLRVEVSAACSKLADYKRVKKFTIRDDEFPQDHHPQDQAVRGGSEHLHQGLALTAHCKSSMLSQTENKRPRQSSPCRGLFIQHNC